jgi:hypothetical protein
MNASRLTDLCVLVPSPSASAGSGLIGPLVSDANDFTKAGGFGSRQAGCFTAHSLGHRDRKDFIPL